MRIAVIDVAAESGGALSVLQEFYNSIKNEKRFSKIEWYFFTSVKLPSTANIHSVLVPKVKKNWGYRLFWERISIKRELESKGIDIVISLQNTAIPQGDYKQYVFFHNVLLLEPTNKYSLFKLEETRFAIYTRFISRYTLWTLKHVRTVFVQMNTVKKALKNKDVQTSISVIKPNIVIDESYYNSKVLPVKGVIYPTSAVPFKKIEDIVICAKKHINWFRKCDFEVLITINGTENKYAKRIKSLSTGYEDVIKLIGFQDRETLLNLYKTHALMICSELESFCIPFSEASCIGVPIIAPDYDYAIERLNTIENSFIYNHRNLNSLFRSIVNASSIVSTTNHNESNEVDSWKRLISKILNDNQ